MFDDQPINNNQIPSNLPIGEPEDIFADTENISISSNKNVSHDLPKTSLPTAVGVGKLQPKAPVQPVSEVKITNPPLGEDIFAREPKMHIMPGVGSELNKIKGPSLAKNLMIFLIVIIGISILGGGSWLVYSLFVREPAPEVSVVETSEFETAQKGVDVNEGVVSEDSAIFLNESSDDQESIEDKVISEEVLFGEQADSDSDNLSNDIELEIGTDPNNWDTDKDGLGDGDEVLVWRSNPLKPDTDGDGYDDGAEVKNGYSPIGPGRIFDLGQ